MCFLFSYKTADIRRSILPRLLYVLLDVKAPEDAVFNFKKHIQKNMIFSVITFVGLYNYQLCDTFQKVCY